MSGHSETPARTAFIAVHRKSFIADIDSILRSCVTRIRNTDLSDDQWAQACLPIKAGGLGIRCAVQLAPSAYLAAFCATADLLSRILITPLIIFSRFENVALDCWTKLTSANTLAGPSSFKQHNRDKPVADAELNRLISD